MTGLTAAQVADRTGRHPVTVRRALATGDLHGHQPVRDGHPVPGSRWWIADAAADAWVRGADQHTQRAACGCPTLRALPTRRAS